MSPADRLERIFEALDLVFDRCGLSGTTMSAIAAEAGMSKRTLYSVFSDRDALFAAYLERIRSEFVHELGEEDHALPLESRLRRLLAPSSRPRPSGLPLAVLRVALAGGEDLSEAARTCLSGFVLRDRSLIKEELDRGVRRGEAHIQDTAQAAAILEAMVRPSIGDILLNQSEITCEPAKRDRFESGLAIFLSAVSR
ncbi:Bacterial regulatory proteins, tetR family [Jannaschia seosinensis]|uniref:Bacterial regulatory proteins, tetR family n=1 Tax=Jannaschia seosinensis TaxID=313367 RepID=A0A0M7BEW1_9RHOB|nr:TetR/AcrR family transcriptional regulator [Jannaschia seosinensis]CUH39856.1 Bacterial regulatory proteins, tetR family [Jannaschia seosinensis]